MPLLSITHYRTTYHNFRLGKAQGAKGETNQFHVEPDMPAVDEALLEEETFFSLAGSITKVHIRERELVLMLRDRRCTAAIPNANVGGGCSVVKPNPC